MSNSGTESSDGKYENQISEIIQEELIDLHGRNGYNSIMQTMMKICGKTEKEIIRFLKNSSLLIATSLGNYLLETHFVRI